MSIPSSSKIQELVEQDYVVAHALHFFGIKFYNYSETTLDELCASKGIRKETFVKHLESIRHEAVIGPDVLRSYSVDLIIEYLKHAHFSYIKQRLPYIASLLKDLPEEEIGKEKDLKLIFPYFVEEFIHHIYEEEDTLFHYILLMNKALSGDVTAQKVLRTLDQKSISNFAVDHSSDDDVMDGIKDITSNYTSAVSSTVLKVVHQELASLEKDLSLHARIENEILFPKALALEKEWLEKLKQTSSLN
ncbi:MAG: hemerythrin domain-containing protein [Cytophagaceae bacterium]|jgi:regulator of cell morphogenesis and NO signaling|nr:hemerythrin domain-containing protein [Cytophagaceae bacterium]